MLLNKVTHYLEKETDEKLHRLSNQVAGPNVCCIVIQRVSVCWSVYLQLELNFSTLDGLTVMPHLSPYQPTSWAME